MSSLINNINNHIMLKVWKEYSIFTEEQIAVVRLNETQDGVILTVKESDKSLSFDMYLSCDEALALSSHLVAIVDHIKK